MATVTAKAFLQSKKLWGASQELTFTADYADGRNKEWASATPSLTFTMQVKNEVGELFELGGKYTVTFEPEES